jgi:hypothetical protein
MDLAQSRHNKQEARQCYDKLLKGLTSRPRVIITDTLKNYGATKREYCQAWNPGRVTASTTGVRTRIGRHVSASVACRG